jgi:hypothetical protein
MLWVRMFAVRVLFAGCVFCMMMVVVVMNLAGCVFM